MHFDLLVIGSGPAGQRAALQGAKAGKKIAIIERHPLIGGGCVHTGTLPSKSFRESVYRWSLGSQRARGRPDMKRLLQRRDHVVEGETQVIADQLKRNGVVTLQGQARFVDGNTLEVQSSRGVERATADSIVIATGSRPVSPPPIQVDQKWVFDSDTILNLKKLPESLIVLGAGIIGCEYASMFSIAGSKVTLVDRRHEILASVDREVVEHLISRFHHDAMEIVLEAQAESVSPTKKGVTVKLSNGRALDAQAVLVAQGRVGNSDGLDLGRAGVKCGERGLIPVNGYFQTSVPHIYAVGDVIGAPALASTSLEQGRMATCHALKLTTAMMAPLYPYGIYTIPEISMIGATEEKLKADKIDYVSGRARYRELARGQIVGDRWGLLKLLVDRRTLKLLGIHILGDNAADLIHIGQAVMAFDGDVEYFIRSVFNYPTLAEAYKTAAFHAINQIRGTTTTI